MVTDPAPPQVGPSPRGATNPLSFRLWPSRLLHSKVQGLDELVHARFRFITHVGDAEGSSFNLSIAAINQEASVLNRFLELGHVYRAPSRFGSIIDTS